MEVVRMFIRSFDKIGALENEDLFTKKLKEDVLAGNVFPAVRKGNIDFYYEGGVLFRFNGSGFSRNRNYKNYTPDGCKKSGDWIDDYDICKEENKFRFSNATVSMGCPTSLERQILASLCQHTFNGNGHSAVVVLDIEVRLNFANQKKCDLVLLDTRTGRIMFVEGKIMRDGRMRCKFDPNNNNEPEVIGQVENYSAMIENKDNAGIICKEYSKHTEIVNKLFGTSYKSEISIVTPAKLLVYCVPTEQKKNVKYSIDKINEQLRKDNVMWNYGEYKPSLDEIWSALCG
jgi:hypothetical protein